MDITKLTAEQRAELKAQLEAEERAEKQKRQDDIDAYKQSVDDFVRGTFERMKGVSDMMRREKDSVFRAADTLISIKDELYDTKTDRHSNSFTSSDGMVSITLGKRTNDAWDDTVKVGIQKVTDFFKSKMEQNEELAALTDMVMALLARDKKGNLKANRVLQLQEVARKSGFSELIEAAEIIKQAYKPVESVEFISVQYKDENGVKQTLPLSLASMDKKS